MNLGSGDSSVLEIQDDLSLVRAISMLEMDNPEIEGIIFHNLGGNEFTSNALLSFAEVIENLSPEVNESILSVSFLGIQIRHDTRNSMISLMKAFQKLMAVKFVNVQDVPPRFFIDARHIMVVLSVFPHMEELKIHCHNLLDFNLPDFYNGSPWLRLQLHQKLKSVHLSGTSLGETFHLDNFLQCASKNETIKHLAYVRPPTSPSENPGDTEKGLHPQTILSIINSRSLTKITLPATMVKNKGNMIINKHLRTNYTVMKFTLDVSDRVLENEDEPQQFFHQDPDEELLNETLLLIDIVGRTNKNKRGFYRQEAETIENHKWVSKLAKLANIAERKMERLNRWFSEAIEPDGLETNGSMYTMEEKIEGEEYYNAVCLNCIFEFLQMNPSLCHNHAGRAAVSFVASKKRNHDEMNSC